MFDIAKCGCEALLRCCWRYSRFPVNWLNQISICGVALPNTSIVFFFFLPKIGSGDAIIGRFWPKFDFIDCTEFPSSLRHSSGSTKITTELIIYLSFQLRQTLSSCFPFYWKSFGVASRRKRSTNNPLINWSRKRGKQHKSIHFTSVVHNIHFQFFHFLPTSTSKMVFIEMEMKANTHEKKSNFDKFHLLFERIWRESSFRAKQKR